MEKNTKKILVFGLFGLFVLVFAMQFVAADPLSKGAQWLNDTAERWFRGGISEGTAKVLFFVLIMLLVKTVIGNIPGLKDLSGKEGGILGFVFAGIVAFLSIAYVTPDEIYALMVGYSAMGYVLAGAVPLIILTFFTINLATDNKGGPTAKIGRKAIAFVIWGGFTLFSVQKAIGGWGNTENWLLLWFFPVAGLIITLYLGTIFTWIGVLQTKEVIATAKKKHLLATTAINAYAEDIKGLAFEEK